MSLPLPAILLVEDEPIVAMDMADCITDAGYQVVGPVATLPDAIRIGRDGMFDAALVDANLAGAKVDEVAAVLTERGIPFAFVTGYARETLPEAFRHVPVIAKPYEHEQLKQIVRSLLARTNSLGTVPFKRSVV